MTKFVKIISEEFDENLEDILIDKNENINDKDETTIKNIYEPTLWNKLDTSLIDLIVEKSLIRQPLRPV